MPRRKFSLQAFMRENDAILQREMTQPTDIIIPVMGPTGVGKSSFINNIVGRKREASERAEVSDGYLSCTARLQPYFVDVPKGLAEKYGLEEVGMGRGRRPRRLVLVDTPGFDDTNLSDAEILRRIAVWLASSYDVDMKVGGVVYMFPIYPNRITRNDRANVKVFQRICGKHGLSKVILATTRWDICPPDSGERREEELRDNFWREMIDPAAVDRKAIMVRLWDEEESAWDVMDQVLKRYVEADMEGVILDIQDQLVKREKKLRETGAAQELRKKLEELLKESEAGSRATGSRDRKERLDFLLQQSRELQIPVSERVRVSSRPYLQKARGVWAGFSHLVKRYAVLALEKPQRRDSV